MRRFRYEVPTSLSEAVQLLASRDEEARPLAGGTDLLVQMRAGRLEPTLLVDLKRIPETNQIVRDPDTGLTIGAAVPCCRIYEDRTIRSAYPCLVDAVGIIGSVAVRGRATVGGNLCNSAPSGDSIPALMVLGATCTIAGPAGSRAVPVERSCTAPGRNVLERGEILLTIQLPPPEPHLGAHYLRFTPRNEMDIAVVGVGAGVLLSEDLRTITKARIALGAVAPTPLLAEEAAESLAGKAPTEDAFAEAAALAQHYYRMPTAVDVPRIETVLVEVANPGHPYGVRGAAEPPIVPVAAAVANAIHRAVGARMNELPMTPATILEKMGALE